MPPPPTPHNKPACPVKVSIRIRPEPNDENAPRHAHNQTNLPPPCITPLKDGKSIMLVPPPPPGPSQLNPNGSADDRRKSVASGGPQTFNFDHVFPSSTSQSSVYSSTVRDLIDDVVDGYSATVFAYGHTGSGKTYTMFGTNENPGIVPRTVEQIFSTINSLTSSSVNPPQHNTPVNSDVIFLVKMSYVELYNNTFRSLLDDPNPGDAPKKGHPNPPSPQMSKYKRDQTNKIEVREHPSSGTFLAGPASLNRTITTPSQAHALIHQGTINRSTASTKCNEYSSRSHSILTIHVESQLRLKSTNVKELRMGKLHLIDLAGSERVSMSGATGSTLTETQNINQSLSALGNVLSTLSKNASNPPPKQPQKPPYRDSKLTHLLKDSLGGNSKTLMLTTLRSTANFYPHTVLSLMYASRAKKIKNHSAVNRDFSADQSSLQEISNDIDGLKQRLQLRAIEFERLSSLKFQSVEENRTLKNKLQIMEAANNQEKMELEEKLNSVIHNSKSHLAVQQQQFINLQSKLAGQLSKYQTKVVEQQKEITTLKSTVEALEKMGVGVGATTSEVEEMQVVLQMWQKQATEAHEELKKTSTNFKGLTQAHTALRQTNLELVEKLKASSTLEQLQSQNYDIDKLTGDLTALTQTKAEIADSISSLKREIEGLKSTRSELNGLLESTSSTCQNHLNSAVTLKNKKITELEGVVHALKTTLADKTQKLISKNDEASSLHKKLEKTNATLKQQQAESVSDVESLRRTNKTGSETIACLKSSLASKTANLEKLQAQTNEVNATILTLQEQFKKVAKEKDAIIAKEKEEKEALQKTNESIKGQLNKFTETLGAVQAEAKNIVEQKCAEIKDLKERVSAQGSDVTEVQAKLNASQAQKTQLKSEMSKKSKELEKAQSTLGKNERILSQYSRRLEDAEAKLKSTEESNSALKKSLKVKSDKEKELAAEVKILNAKLCNANEGLSSATAKADATLDDVTELERSLKAKEERESLLLGEVGNLKTKLLKAQEDLNVATTQCEKTLESVGQSLTGQKKQHEEVVKNLQATIAEKEAKLATTEEDFTKIREGLVKSHSEDIVRAVSEAVKAKDAEKQASVSIVSSNIQREHERSVKELSSTHQQEVKLLQRDLERLSADSEDKNVQIKVHLERVEFLEKEIEATKSAQEASLEDLKSDYEQRVCDLNNEIARTKSAHDTAVEGLKSDFEQRISDLNNEIGLNKSVHKKQLEELKSDYDKRVAILDSSMSLAKVAHGKALEELKNEYERRESETKAAHVEELRELEVRYQQEISEATDGFGNQLEIQMGENSQRVLQLERMLSETRESLAAETAAVKTMHEQEISAWSDKFAKALSDSEEAAKNMRGKHEEEIKGLKALHEQALNDTKSQHDERILAAKKEFDERMKADNADVSTLLSAHEAEVEKARVLHKEQQESLVAFHREVLSTTAKEHEEQLSRLNHQLEQVTAEHAQEKRDNLMKHDLFIAQLNASHSAEKSEMEKELKQKARQNELHLEAEISKLKSSAVALRAEIESTTSSSEEKIRKLKIQHENIVAEVRASHAKELVDASGNIDAQIAALTASHQHDVAVQKANAKKELARLTIEIGRDLEEQYGVRHKEEVSSIKVEHQNELNTLLASHASATKKLTKTLTDQLSNAKEEYAETLKVLRSSHESKMTQLIDTHDQQIHVLQSKLNSSKADYESSVSTQQRLLADLSNKYDSTVQGQESLVEQLESLHQHMRDLEARKNREMSEAVSKLKESNDELQEKCIEMELGQGDLEDKLKSEGRGKISALMAAEQNMMFASEVESRCCGKVEAFAETVAELKKQVAAQSRGHLDAIAKIEEDVEARVEAAKEKLESTVVERERKNFAVAGEERFRDGEVSARAAVCGVVLDHLATFDDTPGLKNVRNIFVSETMSEDDMAGVLDAVGGWAQRQAGLIAKMKGEREKAMQEIVKAEGKAVGKMEQMQRDLDEKEEKVRDAFEKKANANLFAAKCRMIWRGRERGMVGRAFFTWRGISEVEKIVGAKTNEVLAIKKKERTMRAIDKLQYVVKLGGSGLCGRIFQAWKAVVVGRISAERAKVMEEKAEVEAKVMTTSDLSLTRDEGGGEYEEVEEQTVVKSPENIKALKRQLMQEKAARKAILAKAAQKWISPAKGGSSVGELSEDASKATLEGNANLLEDILEKAENSEEGIRGLFKLMLLHRAVSGFHFHGNQQLLLSTLEVLLSKGWDVNVKDAHSNTVLHKALTVCTSNVVLTALKFLLKRGADANAVNGDGDTPMSVEIRRLRSESVDVVGLLLNYGGDVGAKNRNGESILTSVLRLAQRKAGGEGGGLSESVSTLGASGVSYQTAASGADGGSRNGNRNFWVRVSLLLLKQGAKWDSTVIDEKGRNQLMMLFTGPSPPIGDANSHRELLKHGLGNKEFDINARDGEGRTVLHLFCLRESGMSKAACISSLGILEDLLGAGADINIVDNEGAGVLSIVGGFKGNGFELLHPTLVEAVNGSSVMYAKDVRNVVDELNRGREEMARRRRKTSVSSEGGVKILREPAEVMGEGKKKKSSRKEGTMPASIFRTPTARENKKLLGSIGKGGAGGMGTPNSELVRDLWSKSAGKKGRTFSSRQNEMGVNAMR
ncbi:hypothetical protein TrST_g10249 [Triparma strigata]|uniref:Kinesin motor domain-containing protein n=1 Tax=Triparma strigata TaxID=1606541 RepID=A0A9W7DYP7_9STRA|nr:hypothetical protein TrST_g10249 [Triparma strigata]